jgi:alpha-beta hydrolase superfamily lysophospholipase
MTEPDGVVATDVLGAPYTAETLELRPDFEGEVVATLVHRPAATPTGRAVLHVHGFADYFFQTAAADFWVERGYDFYALDLRKYGRSLRPHQTPNYTADLREYYEELDLALERVSEGHDHVVLSAHSTGGLTVPLWLHDRGHEVAGVFLNAPWIDMHGDAFTRLVAMPVIHRLGARQPMRVIPRDVDGSYAKSLHSDYFGEWDFNLDWKPLKSWPAYAGWIRAVRLGQARLARGLDINGPVLMVSSTRSGHPTSQDDPELTSTDTVLDVERMRRRAAVLSRHVTIAQVEGALHDVTLSPAPVRSRVFEEVGRWLSAYVEGPQFH